MGLFVPARRWRIQVDVGNRDEAQIYQPPMPPFVFVGSGSAYRISAIKQRPAGEEEPFYYAPCPNVHHHEDICQGDTPFPVCSPQSIEAALGIFLENSLFNGDLSQNKCCRYPEDVRQLRAVLEGKSPFPLSELVCCRRMLRSL